MTLRELEIFYRLSRTPHLSNLAREMGMSQSALSLALQSLEKKLGEPLFDRLGKRLVLNERGRAFRAETHPHYLALQEARDSFSGQSMSGTLRIASSKTIGDYLMPQIIYDFLIRHPHVSIESQIHNSHDIIAMVEDGTVDMGFIETETHAQAVVTVPLADDQLIVVTSDPHLAKKPVFIDRLFDRKWLMREKGSGTRAVFLKGLGSVAEDFEVFMHYHDFEEAKGILLHHPDTITCLSRHVVTDEIRQGKLFVVPITNLTFQRRFLRIHHRDKHPSKLFETFAQWSHSAINLA